MLRIISILSLIILSFYSAKVSGDYIPFGEDKSAKDVPLPNGWSFCGESEGVVNVHSVTLTPDPPKRGKDLRVNVKAQLLEKLDGGKLTYTVKLGAIPIVRDTTDLCDALKMDPKLPQCPLKKGEWDVTYETILPMETPFGKYNIEAMATDKQGKLIFCLKGTTVIKLFSETNSDSDIEDGKADEWLNPFKLEQFLNLIQ